jgi:transposase
MKVVKLEEYEEITIVEMRKYHPKAKVRERAHAIELSNMGKCIKIVAELLHRTKKTISEWIKNYEKLGIAGLFDKERSGIPKEVTYEMENRIIEIAESNETCTKNSIKEDIETEFGARFHPNTIKYHLKKRWVFV